MENAARGKFPCKDNVVIPELNYRYMWQIMRRRHEANERHLIRTKNLVKEGRLSGTSSFSDWEYNIPEYKQQRDDVRKKHKERFVEEQLALHKLRK
jgi:hypothetical protein